MPPGRRLPRRWLRLGRPEGHGQVRGEGEALRRGGELDVRAAREPRRLGRLPTPRGRPGHQGRQARRDAPVAQRRHLRQEEGHGAVGGAPHTAAVHPGEGEAAQEALPLGRRVLRAREGEGQEDDRRHRCQVHWRLFEAQPFPRLQEVSCSELLVTCTNLQIFLPYRLEHQLPYKVR